MFVKYRELIRAKTTILTKIIEFSAAIIFSDLNTTCNKNEHCNEWCQYVYKNNDNAHCTDGSCQCWGPIFPVVGAVKTVKKQRK